MNNEDDTPRDLNPNESASEHERRTRDRALVPSEVDHLRRHRSDELDSTPVVVIQGSGLGPILSKEEAARQMERIIASSPPLTQEEFLELLCSDVGTAAEVAARLSITQQQLADLVAVNKVIAIRDTRGELQFPLRQFDDNGPLEGLDVLITHFAAPEVAWDFLVSVCRMTYMKPPLDALRAGRVDFDYVLSVAEAQEWGAFS